MESSDKFWLGLWTIIATALISFLVAMLTYNHTKNMIILELVKTGASPIEASCALNDNLGNNPTCIITTKSSEK